MLDTRLRRTLLVHQAGRPSIRGVLVDDCDDGLALRRAVLLREDGQGELPLDGDVLIPWSADLLVQDVSATAGEVRRDRRLRAVEPRPGPANPWLSAPADPRPGAMRG